jgi:TetR/AcrR family acrAB operon transcriptional repressor
MNVTSAARKRTERSARILDTASHLITRYGYDKTTMDDIAREAGVSKGALYLVWSGKEELFDALLKHEMKRLLLDLWARIEADPIGGTLPALYGHTLLALQNNLLMSALYTRDGRVLGDFVHRQDSQRYTQRLLMSQEGIEQMQTAGLLRSDIRPEVMSYLFSIMALGFMSINTIVPADAAPSMTESVAAMSLMVQSGLVLPGGDNAVAKESTVKMLELMLQQYEK